MNKIYDLFESKSSELEMHLREYINKINYVKPT